MPFFSSTIRWNYGRRSSGFGCCSSRSLKRRGGRGTRPLCRSNTISTGTRSRGVLRRARPSTQEISIWPQPPPAPRFQGGLALALAEVKKLIADGYRILVLTGGPGETERLAELFAENQVPYQFVERHGAGESLPEVPADSLAVPSWWITRGTLADGVMIPASRFLILGNQHLFR